MEESKIPIKSYLEALTVLYADSVTYARTLHAYFKQENFDSSQVMAIVTYFSKLLNTQEAINDILNKIKGGANE